MFRRGSSYYITMADPYCAYCAGTGTAYLRASSPLGPWHGVGANVALSMNQMYVDSRMAICRVGGFAICIFQFAI